MGIKRKVLENLAVSFLFFLIVAVFRFKYPLWLSLFFLGGMLGTFILELDFLVYIILNPSESLSLQALSLLNGRVKEGIVFLSQRAHEVRTRVFHTYLFEVIFAVAIFYILTSTASAFSSGVAFFALLHLLKDQFIELSDNHVLSPMWKGFFDLEVPVKYQRFWVCVGGFLLFYFLYILVR